MYGLVDGNNFFVSCERVIDPRLAGKAVAVLSNNDGCCVSRSNEILNAITKIVGALYVPGVKYRKSGVVFFRLSKEDSARQMDLFDTPKESSERVKKLYKAVDALNRHYGRGKVFSAAEGIKREWKMKRSLLSKRVTTSWDDLLVVK